MCVGLCVVYVIGIRGYELPIIDYVLCVMGYVLLSRLASIDKGNASLKMT